MSLFFAPPQPPAERALWLDLGNTRLKYWLTEHGQVLQHGPKEKKPPAAFPRCRGLVWLRATRPLLRNSRLSKAR